MRVKYNPGQRVFALDSMQDGTPIAIHIVVIDSVTITEEEIAYWVKSISPPYEEWGDSVPEDNVSIYISKLVKRLKL